MSEEPTEEELDVEADEGGPADEAEEPETEGLSEGDFVRLAYTIRTVEDDRLVDTTDEAIAEEEGIDTEEQSFEPRIVVIGAGHLFSAVEDDLIGRSVGETGTVTIAGEEAFGEHDPDQVRTVSADKLPEDQRYPGAHVNVDGQHGYVETVIGGRARVDFNHPLAGEDIRYEYEILEEITDRHEQARGLLGSYLDVDLELSIEEHEEERDVLDEEGEIEGIETVTLETLYLEATPQLAMNQQWLFSKQQIAGDLIDRIGVDRVVVREILDGSGGIGGLGGMGTGFDEALEEADLEDADIDTDELVEELEAETSLDAEE